MNHSEVLQFIINFIDENRHKHLFTGVGLLSLYGPFSTWTGNRPFADRIRDILYCCDYGLLDSIFRAVSVFGIDFEIVRVFNEVCISHYTTVAQQASLMSNYIHDGKFI